MNKRSLIVNVQAFHRGLSVRRHIASNNAGATVLQSLWRGYWTRLQYTWTTLCIIIVQSAFRRWAASRELSRQRYAVGSIQRVTRCWLAAKRLKKQQSDRHEHKKILAATTLCQVRSFWAELYWICCTIQDYSAMPGLIFRLFYLYQSIIRRRFAINQVKAYRTKAIAATVVQKHWRAHRDRASFVRTRLFVIILQSCLRRYLVRCEQDTIHLFALMIQRNWRSFSTAANYQQVRTDIVCCQSIVRGRVARNTMYLHKMALLRMQCISRAWIAKRRMQALRNQREEERRILGAMRRLSATKLQACYRGYLIRCDYHKLAVSAIALQRLWRGHTSKLHYHMFLIDIITVQSIVRRKAANCVVEMRIRAIVQMQCATRRWQAFHTVDALRERRSKQCRQQKACILIQKVVRRLQARNQLHRHRSARSIQKNWRSFRIHVKYMISAFVIIIQSAVRGHLVRLSRSNKIKRIAERVVHANIRAREDPSMKLGARTASALAVLEKSRFVNWGKVNDAVEMLERSTRLSEIFSIVFIQANASEVLFRFCHLLNRSLPHTETLWYVLLTLKNVSSYETLLPSMASKYSVVVLLDLLQTFRDKEMLFALITSLLKRFVFTREELMVRMLLARTQRRF